MQPRSVFTFVRFQADVFDIALHADGRNHAIDGDLLGFALGVFDAGR
jgi:hypothetical protein